MYGKNGVYGVAKDVTQQQLAEKKILEDRHMLRAIIDNIPDYIFVKDINHRSILANKKFSSEILGIELDESASGYSPLDYLGESIGKQIIADNDEVIQSGIPVINRHDLVTTISGKQEMVLLTKVPLQYHILL